jgi:hypothetical protein
VSVFIGQQRLEQALQPERTLIASDHEQGRRQGGAHLGLRSRQERREWADQAARGKPVDEALGLLRRGAKPVHEALHVLGARVEHGAELERVGLDRRDQFARALGRRPDGAVALWRSAVPGTLAHSSCAASRMARS